MIVSFGRTATTSSVFIYFCIMAQNIFAASTTILKLLLSIKWHFFRCALFRRCTLYLTHVTTSPEKKWDGERERKTIKNSLCFRFPFVIVHRGETKNEWNRKWKQKSNKQYKIVCCYMKNEVLLLVHLFFPLTHSVRYGNKVILIAFYAF